MIGSIVSWREFWMGAKGIIETRRRGPVLRASGQTITVRGWLGEELTFLLADVRREGLK
jgi:hypothetical protein